LNVQILLKKMLHTFLEGKKEYIDN